MLRSRESEILESRSRESDILPPLRNPVYNHDCAVDVFLFDINTD